MLPFIKIPLYAMSPLHDPLYIEFISRLRHARKEKGWSQKEFGKRLEKKQSYVSKVETCERRLDIIETIQWCQVLEVYLVEVLPPEFRTFFAGK